jgi:hypothetical protein
MPVLLKNTRKYISACFRNYMFCKGKNIRAIQSKCLYE